MSTGTHWTSPEDIDADFAAISDLYDDTAKYTFKPSVQERKARSKPSIYIDSDQDIPYNELFIPRGRGAAFLDENFKLPGGLPSFMQRQYEEITNDIRQTSEFRFDSDDIVQSLHGSKQTSSSSSLSSAKSSSTSWHTSSESPLKELISREQSDSPTHTTEDIKQEERPPPLYEIIKFGYTKKQKPPLEIPPLEKPPSENPPNILNGLTKKKTTNKNIDTTNMFFPVNADRFDIESIEEFPALI